MGLLAFSMSIASMNLLCRSRDTACISAARRPGPPISCEGTHMDLRSIYLNDQGRIARLPYFGYSLALTVPYMIVAYLLASLLGVFGGILVLALYAVVAYPYYCLMAKRLQDFGQPGKYAVAVIGVGIAAALLQFVEALHGVATAISALQALVGLVILFVPGNPGDNAYGAPPAKLATA